MKRHSHSGRFLVTGPGVDKACPSPGAALSGAQYAACRYEQDADFYVRVLGEEMPLYVVSRRAKVVTTSKPT